MNKTLLYFALVHLASITNKCKEYYKLLHQTSMQFLSVNLIFLKLTPRIKLFFGLKTGLLTYFMAALIVVIIFRWRIQQNCRNQKFVLLNNIASEILIKMKCQLILAHIFIQVIMHILEIQTIIHIKYLTLTTVFMKCNYSISMMVGIHRNKLFGSIMTFIKFIRKFNFLKTFPKYN